MGTDRGRRRATNLRTSLVAVVLAALLLVAAPFAAADDGPLVVLIADGATGEPLPATTVAIALEGEGLPESMRAPWSVAVTTDSEGRATIAGGAAASAVRASTLDRAGRTVREPDETEPVVFLAPHGSLVLQVVDADGHPCLGLALRSSGPSRRDPVPATAGRFGTLVLPLRAVHPSLPALRVLPELPFAEVPAIELPREPSDTPPLLRLRLPRTVAVEVAVSGLGEGAAVARLRHPGTWTSEDQAASLYTVPVVDGRSTFALAPPSRELMVEVVPKDERRPVARAMVTTPAAGEPALRVEVAVGRVRATLTGRLLDESGRPVGGRLLQLSFLPARPFAWDLWSQRPRILPTTAADGTFRLPTDRDAAELEGARFVVEEFRPRPESNGGGDLFRLATVGPVVPHEDGTVDLGDLRAPAAYRLVAGRVVDEDGAPVSGAIVWVQRRVGDQWRGVPRGAVQSDADGAFALDATVPAGDLRLAPRAPGRRAESPVPFDRGADGVVVRLVRAAAFELRAKLPPGAEVPDTSLRLDEVAAASPSPGGGAAPPPSRSTFGNMRDRSLFGFDDLAPGPVTASLLWRGEVVWGPERFELRAGESTGPRDVIDVAGTLRTVAVSVVHEDGSPAAGARIVTRAPSARSGWRATRTDAAGRATVLVGRGALVALAHGTDQDTGWSAEREGAITVTLRRRTPQAVRLHIPPPPQVPEAPIRFSVGLSWLGPPGTLADAETYVPQAGFGAERVPVTEDGTAVVEVLEPGVYAVECVAECRGLHGGFTQTLHFAPPQTVTVPGATGTVPSLDVAPDPDEVARIAAAAAER